jgi:hypothetical protein
MGGDAVLMYAARRTGNHISNTSTSTSTSQNVAKGVRLSFSRVGDSHLDCNNVTVEIDVRCDPLAPTVAAAALVVGQQESATCDWHLIVRSANVAVCNPGKATSERLGLEG